MKLICWKNYLIHTVRTVLQEVFVQMILHPVCHFCLPTNSVKKVLKAHCH